MLIPRKSPLTPTRASRTSGSRQPAAQNAHIENAETAMPDWVASRTRLRSYRSASAPPSGPNIMLGRNCQRLTRPTQNALPVSW